jgi:hypothetical protein
MLQGDLVDSMELYLRNYKSSSASMLVNAQDQWD